MAAARETESQTPPLMLQTGWMIERHGIGVLGDSPSICQLLQADHLVNIYRIFVKLNSEGGIKRMTPNEWRVVRDTTKAIEGW